MYEPDAEESLIKDYLLGRLGAEPQRLFEERFLTDLGFQALALMVEDELIESYVFNLMPAREREQFVSRYMSNPRQADKVELFSLLNSYAGARQTAVRESWWARLWAPLRERRWRPAFALAAALLLVTVLAGLLLVQRRAARERESARARREAVEREVGRLNGGGEAGQTKVAPDEVFAVTLSPLLVRGSGEMPRVSAPAGARVVELRLALLSEERSYSATLLTDSGEELFTLRGLDARAGEGGGVLSLNVPAGLLTAGDYQLRLVGVDGGGRQTREAVYPFRVPAR